MHEPRTRVYGPLIACLMLIASVPGVSASLPGHQAVDTVTEKFSTDKECRDKPDGGGVGGNHGECTFRCDADDKVTVHVRSSDEDADVKGQGECGSAVAECGWKQEECSDFDWASTSGEGTCTGESDEVWDSALTVECKAEEPEDTLCPDELPICPIPSLGTTCKRIGIECRDPTDDATVAASSVSIQSSVVLHIEDGTGTAIVCQGQACRPVEPTCWVDPITGAGGCTVEF